MKFMFLCVWKYGPIEIMLTLIWELLSNPFGTKPVPKPIMTLFSDA